MTGGPETVLIQLEHVYKRFDRTVALRDVCFSIAAGESIALLGANGAGKTTLLRTLATLTRPTRGRVLAFGVDAWVRKAEVRRRVGVVAHQPYIYPELSCRENLLFFARMFNVSGAEGAVEASLRRVGLANRSHDRASALSRGLLQRLNLARAILHAPAVLVLDEPDTGLDVAGRRVLASLIEEQIARGGSVIFTSHQLDFALDMASRVIVISDGQVEVDRQRDTVERVAIINMLAGEPLALVSS